jgi:GT2 family glycosyltransferase
MKNSITTIITLYKTPLVKLKNLKQYKKFNLKIFEQEGSLILKKKLKKILKRNFEYLYSKNNIGLPKASNILLKKVKSKYLLFTQADILIDNKSVLKLVKIFKKDKDIIFVTPNITNRFKNIKKKKNISFVKNIKAACMMCDVDKLKKIKFFDEDYFLYWEDIDLIKKINESKFKMVLANNIFAKHHSSQSSEYNIKTQYLRTSNYIYGELVYDFKNNKLKIIKVIRKLLQNFILFFLDIIRLKFKISLIRIFNILGILKFILYYIFVKILR